MLRDFCIVTVQSAWALWFSLKKEKERNTVVQSATRTQVQVELGDFCRHRSLLNVLTISIVRSYFC